jgi:outer membrane protein assembly factor BamB
MSWNFNRTRQRIGLLLLTVVFAQTLCRNADAGITLPDENNDAETDLRSYLVDITGAHFDSAADRYWGLANNHGRDLISRPDGSFVGVRDALDAIPADAMTQVVALLRARHGADAAAAITAVTADPHWWPHDLYSTAMRCRHTAESDSALTTAAARAMAQGDTATAALLSGKPPADPAVSVVPFQANWFGTVSGYPAEKVIPISAGDMIFVANNVGGGTQHGHLMALSENGTVKWMVRSDRSPGVDRYASISIDRGPVSIPGIVTDDTGHPQIAITRFTGGTSGGWLAAYRASDGRLLWSTADTLPGVAVLSSPSIAGRFACCIGLESGTDPSTADLQLIAFDVTDGRAIWRTHLAAITEIPIVNQGGGFRWLGFFLDQGPPLISGGSVVIAPGIGAVMSVDRIDGTIHWIRPYGPAVIDENQLRSYHQQRQFGNPLAPPTTWTQLLRWTNTPVVAGGIVVAAPQDTDMAYGIDLATGKNVWQSNGLPPGVPVTVAGGKVIWAGQFRRDVEALTAVDPTSGQGSWTFEPKDRARVTGLPVVRGNRIVVWTSAGRAVLDTAQGNPARDGVGIDFDAVISTEAGRSTLRNAEMTGSFAGAR